MNYQKLFNYMKAEHGVTLLESDMQEIRNIVCGHESEKDICTCSKSENNEAGQVTSIRFEPIKKELPYECCHYIESLGLCPVTNRCKKCSTSDVVERSEELVCTHCYGTGKDHSDDSLKTDCPSCK